MSNQSYDFLKQVATIWLPALATFWGAVGIAWGIPFTEQVVITITALDTALGTVLGVSNKSYRKEADGLSEPEG